MGPIFWPAQNHWAAGPSQIKIKYLFQFEMGFFSSWIMTFFRPKTTWPVRILLSWQNGPKIYSCPTFHMTSLMGQGSQKILHQARKKESVYSYFMRQGLNIIDRWRNRKVDDQIRQTHPVNIHRICIATQNDIPYEVMIYCLMLLFTELLALNSYCFSFIGDWLSDWIFMGPSIKEESGY